MDSYMSDRTRVELSIPSHMMLLLADAARREGYEIRGDVFEALGGSALVPLSGLTKLEVPAVAKRVDEVSVQLLQGAGGGDPVVALMEVAMFILVLVEEGLYVDKTSACIPVALLFVEDAKEGGLWDYDENILKDAAHRLLVRARLLGYYHSNRVQSIAQKNLTTPKT